MKKLCSNIDIICQVKKMIPQISLKEGFHAGLRIVFITINFLIKYTHIWRFSALPT
jgi:hypothetical protein